MNFQKNLKYHYYADVCEITWQKKYRKHENILQHSYTDSILNIVNTWQ